MVKPDVVVVGGGPAGSVTARELGRRGVRVALLERERHPRPKPCGEGLLPQGAAALAEMGLSFPGNSVRGLRYVSPGGARAETDFPGAGLVVRRERFDAFLFEAAASTPNVTTYQGTAYEPERWKAPWVVGADGLRSLFHAGHGFRVTRPRAVRLGLSTHVRGLELDPDRVEVLFHARGEVYLAPAGGGEVLVACLFRREESPGAVSNEARVRETLEALEPLRARRGSLEFTTPVLGAGPLGLVVKPAVRGRTLLVGDASGAPDPVIGDGMSLAIRSARAAADAIVAGRPLAYERERRRLSEGADWVSRWILRASRHAWLADRIVSSLARRPDLFSALVGIAGGSRPRGAVSFADLLGLAA